RILNTFVGQSGHVLRWKFAQSGNTHVTFPFLDLNLIRYSMTIPDYFRVNRGQEKPILASAFKDILPKKIIDRRTRGSFLELVLRGINENYELIKTIILDSDSHNFISRSKMLQYLDNIYHGKTVSIDLIDKFCLTLAILIWYDKTNIMYYDALSQVDFLISSNSLE
ncbi:MAG: asparagine synthase-related protein, partial [Dolichospermum sp.]